jgi:hypothetical protein
VPHGGFDETNLYEIRPLGQEPGATLLDHPQALAAFANKYRQLLSVIEEAHSGAPSLSLLPAVPADAAIALGQIRTPAANPPLRVYDRDKETGQYGFVCEVGR